MNAAFEFILEQIRGVWRFRWTAMLVAWIVCLVGWLVILMIPDTYSAWARVYVDTRTRLSQVTQGIAVESNIASSVESVREALLGAPQLEKVARLAIPAYAGATPEQQRAIINGLRTRLTVEGNGDARQAADLYVISYTDHDAKNAHHVVDQLLHLFMSNTLGGSQLGSEQAQEFLTKQIADYDKKLQAAEARLADFKRQNAGLVPGATGGDYFSRLQADTDELNKNRLALTVAEQKRDELHRQLVSEQPLMGASPVQAGVRRIRRAPFAKLRGGLMSCSCAIPTSTRTSSLRGRRWRTCGSARRLKLPPCAAATRPRSPPRGWRQIRSIRASSCS